MNRAVLTKTGPLCTVQDLGRPGGRRAGLAPGGAMDRSACLWVNRLLDNDPRSAALEITIGGAILSFEEETVVALAGADCNARLDGESVGNWRTLRVRAGQELRYGFASTGVRSYLGFLGGIDAPTAFGSASVVLREGLEGPLGRPMRVGDAVVWRGGTPPTLMRVAPRGLVAEVTDLLQLPLITAYEWPLFSAGDRETVWDSEWTVGVASDRVATRLDGPTLDSGPLHLDSTPMVDGTVQVPGNGVPLVFMRDRPTIGGYPKLGSVDPGVLDLLAQSRPGTRVRFVPADAGIILANERKRRTFFRLDGDPIKTPGKGP